MSINLTRVDYITVGVTSRNTTRILSKNDPKATHKFVVGDHEGILHIYGMKKNELQLIFKSLPGPKIEKVCLGGTLGLLKDKIFIAYDNSVKGFTKKGKIFLEFDTSLIDPITSMFVLGPDLAACSRDLYHRYQNCKDADSLLIGEILNDVVLIPGENSSVIAVLACGDRAIRVLTGTKTPTILRLPSIPTILSLYREGDIESRNRILVGTQDGKIGLITIQNDKTIRVTWLIVTNNSEITSLDTYELDGTVDILVGRHDGTVEVYGFPDEDDITSTLRFEYNAAESISSVVGGKISSADHPEILVTTYSGKIFGLTTKPSASSESKSSEETLERLKMEIRELEMKLSEEKDFVSDSYNDFLIPLVLSVSHRMVLDKDTSSYLLSIELDSPIDNILIQSDTPVELLDESNNAVLSFSVCNPFEDNFVLATYRCQIDVNRVETRVKTIEGQYGMLQIYVTSQAQPKCCRKIKIPVHALSLHLRIYQDDNILDDNKQFDIHSGPFNELKLTGSFTVAEMHAWLTIALPDIPERPNLNKDNEANLIYLSTFVGSVLKIKYKKGSAIFLGENISTIIILRDILTKEATKRKTKLDVNCNIDNGTVRKVLELVMPRLIAVNELLADLRIIDALQEWEMKNDPIENLSTQYQDLLKREDTLRNQLKKDPNILQRLNGVIIDLYVDWERAKGSRRMSSKVAAEELNPALESNSMEEILQIILKETKDNDSISNNK